jgi:hypothetical protein
MQEEKKSRYQDLKNWTDWEIDPVVILPDSWFLHLVLNPIVFLCFAHAGLQENVQLNAVQDLREFLQRQGSIVPVTALTISHVLDKQSYKHSSQY